MIFRAEQHKQRTAQSPRMMRARVCCGTTGRYLSQRLGSEQTPGRVSKPHSSGTPTTSIALRMHPIAHPEHPFRNPHVPEELLWPLNSSVVRRAGCFSCSQHSICCGRLGDCAALLDMHFRSSQDACGSGCSHSVPCTAILPIRAVLYGSPMVVQAFVDSPEQSGVPLLLSCTTNCARVGACKFLDMCSLNPRRFACHLRHRQC